MNNSNSWYTEKEVLSFIGFGKDKCRRLLKDVQQIKLSNRRLYFKPDVAKLISDKEIKVNVEEYAKLNVTNGDDVDLDLYATLNEALNIVGVTRQRLYQLKDSGRVKSVIFGGFNLFLKEDLLKYS